MATPEIRAQEPEQPYAPDLDLAVATGSIAIEQTVEFVPDYMTMSIEEYRAYVHWTALSGDIKGTSLQDLLIIKDALNSHYRAIASQTVGLTVSVSNLHTELASGEDKQRVMDEMVAASESLFGLYSETLSVQDKRRWVEGYIGDRQPQPTDS